MYWKVGNEWFTMRIDKKYEKGFAVRHITEYIAAGLLGIYFFIFIKSSNKARKEKKKKDVTECLADTDVRRSVILTKFMRICKTPHRKCNRYRNNHNAGFF